MKTNILPPPLVAIIFALAIWWSTGFQLLIFPDAAIAKTLGKTIILLAIIIDLSALYTFIKAKTSIDPLQPKKTTALVTTGPYRFSRNPMYVGLSGLLLGWGLIQNNWLTIPMLFFFVLYISTMQIRPEEKLLSEKFGEAFQTYKSRVRMWL